MSPVADTAQPFSEVVRETGRQAATSASVQGDAWRKWADRLDELIHDLPSAANAPSVHGEDAELAAVPMGATHLGPRSMRASLNVVLAEADAVTTALYRAAAVAEARSVEVANMYEIDEAHEDTPVCPDCEPPESTPDGGGRTLRVTWHPDAVRAAVDRAAAVVAKGDAGPYDPVPGGVLALTDLACLVDAGRAALGTEDGDDRG